MFKLKTVTIFSLLIVHGCAWRDRSEHISIASNYEVGWDDLESNRCITKLNQKCGDGCFDVIVDSYVYSVGHTDGFIFAKQYPNLDTTVTKYFLIDINKNELDVKKGIYGPLDEQEFSALLKRFEITSVAFDKNFANIH